jgi:uncharacterized membrane protein YqgA involved in biofilm formation
MALNLGDSPNIDGNPISTDSDIEELGKELEQAEQKAKKRTIAGFVFSVLTFMIGLLI